MTARDALLWAKNLIWQRDAEVLLGHALRRERTWLLAHPETVVEPRQLASFEALVERRKRGEPLQYILRVQEFFGLTLRVSPSVLIPRPETEHLVEAVLEWAAKQKSDLRLADVGTGSGAIALALAKHLPQADVVATDVSEAALAVAKANALELGLERRIQFLQTDLLEEVCEVGHPFDAVVSNPPYVPAGDAATMQREVVEHEPHGALFAGKDGLDVYRRLIPQAQGMLRKGGLLAMEIGFGQREDVLRLLNDWSAARFIRDYAGIDRVVLAERT